MTDLGTPTTGAPNGRRLSVLWVVALLSLLMAANGRVGHAAEAGEVTSLDELAMKLGALLDAGDGGDLGDDVARDPALEYGGPRQDYEWTIWDGLEGKQYLDTGSIAFQLGVAQTVCVAELIAEQRDRSEASAAADGDEGGPVAAPCPARFEALWYSDTQTGRWIYSIPDTAPGNPGDDVDITGAMSVRLDVDPGLADELFAPERCGRDGPLRVLCPADTDVAAPDVGDELLVVAVRTGGALPWRDGGADSDTFYQYALVADSDGDPDNDFVARDPFTWDFWQGTDRWFILDGNSGQPPEFVVTDSNFMVQASNARLVMTGADTLFFILDAAEISDAGGWRASAFRSAGGTYAPEDSAGDVTGADPTGPLMAFPTDPVNWSLLAATDEAPAADEEPAAGADDAVADAGPELAADASESGGSSFPLGVVIGGALVLIAGGGWLFRRSRPVRAEAEFVPDVDADDVTRALEEEITSDQETL